MKGIAGSILVVIFGGLSAAVWGAFLEINTNTTKLNAFEKRIDRDEIQLDSRLKRIEDKLDLLLIKGAK